MHVIFLSWLCMMGAGLALQYPISFCIDQNVSLQDLTPMFMPLPGILTS
jgi:hypothetical protein